MTTVSDLPGPPLLAAPGVESPVPPTVETTPGDPAYDEHVDVSGADADVWHIEERRSVLSEGGSASSYLVYVRQGVAA